ncbi:MAG: hypothetical protein C4576_00860 [Desulfobacteraceae bacterium]|nr:MAG: hypothetical protein C4576_00860 [Desulfobacteraceae bacterium]
MESIAGEAESKGNPFLVQNLSRGVIEAKPLRDNLSIIAGTKQVERYWKRYGMVLFTNFLDMECSKMRNDESAFISERQCASWKSLLLVCTSFAPSVMHFVGPGAPKEHPVQK